MNYKIWAGKKSVGQFRVTQWFAHVILIINSQNSCSIFLISSAALLAKIAYWFYKAKYQQRGSLHIHISIWLENVSVYGCDDNSLTNNHLWKTKRWSRIRASCQQKHSQAQPNLKSQNRQKFSIITMALHHNLMMFTHGMSESKFCFTIFIGKVKQYYFMLIAC